MKPSAAITDNVEVFLKDIPGANPCGTDVRQSGGWRGVQQNYENYIEQLKKPPSERAPFDKWETIIENAKQVLSSQSKDLTIAVYLTLALVKRSGFSGLSAGLMLLRELHVKFWDGLYPLIEDGELDGRINCLELLNLYLPEAIHSIPLTSTGNGQNYTYSHYLDAQEMDNRRKQAGSDHERRKQVDADLRKGMIDGAQFNRAMDSTSVVHCSTLLGQSQLCSQQFEQLIEEVDRRYENETPDFTPIKKALSECQALLQKQVKTKGGVPVTQVTTEERQSTRPSQDEGGMLNKELGTVNDRVEALRHLATVAEFFRRTERHNPAVYLIERAIKWGEMPLEKWLEEVIRNPGVLGEVRETLGIKGEKP